MKLREKILRCIEEHGQISVHEIAQLLNVSRQYVHRVLSDYEDEDLVIKTGVPPKVLYSAKQCNQKNSEAVLSYDQERFLQEHFITIDPLGIMLEGLEAMKYWCEKQDLPLIKTIDEYITTRKKYLNYYDDKALINGLEKLQKSKGIGNVAVDELYYLDFYAIERFGKTRLGTLMHYAKQGQNKALMKIIVSEIRQRVLNLIQKIGIDAVVYVPPTISRKVQIMSYLEKQLKLDMPRVKVGKIKTQIIVPQKALSKIFERVANAKNTFFVPIQPAYKHILIIDDAIGSGATMNEIAVKLKDKKIAKKITGLAITGSLEGFEVISEL